LTSLSPPALQLSGLAAIVSGNVNIVALAIDGTDNLFFGTFNSMMNAPHVYRVAVGPLGSLTGAPAQLDNAGVTILGQPIDSLNVDFNIGAPATYVVFTQVH
jgi:hypothetical protein